MAVLRVGPPTTPPTPYHAQAPTRDHTSTVKTEQLTPYHVVNTLTMLSSCYST